MIFRIYLSSPFFNDFQRWPLWLPVFLGLGICLYFSLTFEPPLWIASGGMFVFGVTLVFVRLQLLRLLCLSIGMITLGFSVSAAVGTYFVFYLYAKFFKLIEHKLTFIVQNINFLIAALTGIVAISSVYKMYF